MTDLVDERMDQRLAAAARRWQAELPAPPAVPLDRLGESRPRRPSRYAVLAAAAAVVVVGGGTLGLVRTTGGDSSTPSGLPTSASPVHEQRVVEPIVPWRDLKAGHPKVGHRSHGRLVTRFDNIAATGHIHGRAHPGEMLRFVVSLESATRVSLHPCPDYSIVFGPERVTRRLNCAQVPYSASVPLPGGGMSEFLPTLPPGTSIGFQIRVRVPDVTGRQKVVWMLDGPASRPGFYGVVRVSRR